MSLDAQQTVPTASPDMTAMSGPDTPADGPFRALALLSDAAPVALKSRLKSLLETARHNPVIDRLMIASEVLDGLNCLVHGQGYSAGGRHCFSLGLGLDDWQAILDGPQGVAWLRGCIIAGATLFPFTVERCETGALLVLSGPDGALRLDLLDDGDCAALRRRLRAAALAALAPEQQQAASNLRAVA